MTNAEAARLFDLMADLVEIRGDDPFRIRLRASHSIEAGIAADWTRGPRSARDRTTAASRSR